MCGIVVVVRRPSLRALPSMEALEAGLAEVLASLTGDRSAATVTNAAERVEAINRELGGVPGLRALLAAPTSLTRLDGICVALDNEVAALELGLDDPGVSGSSGLESANAALVRLKDAVWCVRRDRLRN